MDLLSQVLQVVKLDSAIYFNCEFSEPWCLAAGPSSETIPLLAPQAGHMIIFHLLVEGTAYVEVGPERRRTEVQPGDVIALPHGSDHTLGCGVTNTVLVGREIMPGLLRQCKTLELVRAGGEGPGSSRWICGFLACDPQLGRGFLSGLPELIKINLREDAAGQWLENSLRFSVTQKMSAEPGADAMLAKLSETVFVETVRRYVSRLPDEQTGWLAGTRDTHVGKALGLLHERPAEDWTIAGLAQEVGISRSVLAERFRHFLGEPPMAYLTRWRMRLGAQSLKTTSKSVAEIAPEVGYESEAAFNRAFKREFGTPPARYRSESRVAAAG